MNIFELAWAGFSVLLPLILLIVFGLSIIISVSMILDDDTPTIFRIVAVLYILFIGFAYVGVLTHCHDGVCIP
jgi:hypothetical protein